MAYKLYKDIYEFGIYYNPATDHYDDGSEVECKMCQKNNLSSSIGWISYDLCLSCTSKIENIIDNKKNKNKLTIPSIIKCCKKLPGENTKYPPPPTALPEKANSNTFRSRTYFQTYKQNDV